jgi:hypothetical protein
MTLRRFADSFAIAGTRRFRIGPEQLTLADEARLASTDAALYRAKANGRNRCETADGRGHPPGAELQPAV